MFAESMLETSWAQRSRRSWTTATSFGLQAIIIASVIVLSLLKSVVMPSVQVVSTPIFAGKVEPMPLGGHPHSGGSSGATQNSATVIRIMRPSSLPIGIPPGSDEPAPEPSGSGIGSFGPSGGSNELPFALGGSRPLPAAPVVPPPPVREFRTSTMLEGNLMRKVQPVYPPLARSARIQGPVVLEAVISKAGTIENLRLISGHPMLVPAAIEAVRQWRYRPYVLNNELIEVETQITVNFILGGT